MKLSFSLPSKSSASKPKNPPKAPTTFGDTNGNQNDDVSKQYVKEFDASKPLPGDPKAKVIPPIPNEWRPHKKMRNLDLPITEPGGKELQFEVESLSASAGGPESNIVYGLTLRKKESESEDQGGDGRLRSGGVEETLLQKFKSDMDRLSDVGFDEFDGMPVEEFAPALLSGYGWQPGMGIGKNTKQDVKVVEYHKRTDKHGLGFDVNSMKKEKEGGGDVGKEVRIVSGREYVGLKGRVVDKLGNGKLVLKLAKEKEEVTVNKEDVAELGSKEEDKCMKRLKEAQMKVGNKPIRQPEQRGKGYSSWLTRHIRVRIISKDLKGGRFYLKKGEVLDVVGPNTCDISMDGSREFVQGVSQDLLETALPRRGGPVLVLSGKHKGVYGSLVEKDSDRETGVVRDADTHVLLNVSLEQIAEFTGDPSHIGY